MSPTVHPVGSFNKTTTQEPSPDAAGLEPSTEGPSARVSPLEYAKAPKTWTDHAVSSRLILTLALPSVVEQLISATVGLTDTIVAGHTGTDDHVRAAAAAAVTSMTYLQWFAGLMTSALGVGATAIVARSIGAKKPRIANRIAGTAVTAAFLIGIFVALLFYFAAYPLAWLFGLQELSADFAAQYLRIMAWTVCLQTAGQIGMACLRGAGDTFRPMLVTISIALVNGVAAPAFCFGWFGLPALGIRGNAIGTLLAFAVAGIFTAVFLFSGGAGLKLRVQHLRIIPHQLARISRIGIPSWLESLLLWGGQIAVVMLVMRQVDSATGHPGSGDTIAAHGAVLRIESLAFLPGYGFGIACSALVGQYLGARKPDQAQRTARLALRLTVITMTIAAAPMVFFSHFLLRLLVDSDPVVDLGWIPLILAGLAQPGFALAIVKSSALRGAGETLSPMIATMTGMGGRVLIILGLMPILTATGHAAWGLITVWICIFLDLTYRGFFLQQVFRRGNWKHKKV